MRRKGGKHSLGLQDYQWHREGELEAILSHHANTGEQAMQLVRHSRGSASGSTRSLLLSGIVEIRVQMRVKGELEKFGWKQGCVCRDLLSTVVETHPLVWVFLSPWQLKGRYTEVTGVSHTTPRKSSD